MAKMTLNGRKKRFGVTVVIDAVETCGHMFLPGQVPLRTACRGWVVYVAKAKKYGRGGIRLFMSLLLIFNENYL